MCAFRSHAEQRWLRALAGEDDEDEDTSSRDGDLPDEEAAVPKPAPHRDIRKGVHELEGAADNVHYAAAIAALVRWFADACVPSFMALCACCSPALSVVPG